MHKDKILQILDITIEWCFYSIIIAVTFSTSIVEIASSLMIAAWIVKRIVSRDFKSIDSVPFRIFILFLLWTILSCVNSDYFSESFRGVFKFVQYGLMFLIAATEVRRETFMRRLCYAIIISTVIVCLDGFFQYFFGTDLIRQRQLIRNDYLRRISSSFVHPNDFGVYLLMMGIVFVSFLSSQYRRLRERAGFFALFILSLVCLFLTKSRGAWISFSMAFLVLGALKPKKVATVFLVIFLTVCVILPFAAQERVKGLMDLKSGTTWERLMLWKGTINMIKVHPVLGFGVNTYSRNFPQYKPENYPDVRYSHNCYLQMASEVGIVGALLFVVFLGSVFIFCLKGIRGMPGGMRRDLTSGLFAGTVGFSLNSIVDTHLYSVNLAVLFYLLLGCCFSLSCYARKE